MRLVAVTLLDEGRRQREVGPLLGVDRTTVSRWLSKSAPNVQVHNRRKPDARVMVTREGKYAIADRIEEGESQAQVAADYGISRQYAGRIAKRESSGSRSLGMSANASAMRRPPR